MHLSLSSRHDAGYQMFRGGNLPSSRVGYLYILFNESSSTALVCDEMLLFLVLVSNTPGPCIPLSSKYVIFKGVPQANGQGVFVIQLLR